jgi:hypothetical protein
MARATKRAMYVGIYIYIFFKCLSLYLNVLEAFDINMIIILNISNNPAFRKKNIKNIYDGLQRRKHKIIFEMHYSAIVFHWKTLTVHDFSFSFLFLFPLKTVFGNYFLKTSSKEIFCSYFGRLSNVVA